MGVYRRGDARVQLLERVRHPAWQPKLRREAAGGGGGGGVRIRARLGTEGRGRTGCMQQGMRVGGRQRAGLRGDIKKRTKS